MNKSESIGTLAAALSKAQGKYKSVVRNCTNPFFKSHYADLAAIFDATREALVTNELSVIQTNETSDNGKLVVTTTLMHSSGEWVSGTLSMKPVKEDPQGQGSCLTYIRRYAMQQILGVASEDEDDGNAASQEGKKEGKKTEIKLLTTEELISKMETSQNIFELKARHTKYAPDIAALQGEDRVKVIMAKDKRKIILQAEEKANKEAEGDAK